LNRRKSLTIKKLFCLTGPAISVPGRGGSDYDGRKRVLGGRVPEGGWVIGAKKEKINEPEKKKTREKKRVVVRKGKWGRENF